MSEEEKTGQETGNQGDEGGSFLDSLPEDLREEPSLADFKDVGSLAKSYVHAQKLVGHDKLPLPASDDDDTAWNEVYNRLGRPSSAEEYELEVPDEKEDGFTIDEDTMGAFKKTAHEAGLTPKQVQAMMGFNIEFIKNAMVEGEMAHEKQYEAATTELRKEYGATYDEKISLANRALEHFGGEELVEMLGKAGLDNNTAMVKAFVKIGEEIGEDKFGKASAGTGNMTPAEARGKINTLKIDKKFMEAYTDRYHSGHAAAVSQMQELYKMAYPS